MNNLPSFKDTIKAVLFFKEPEPKEVFILKENKFDKILEEEMIAEDNQTDKDDTQENETVKREGQSEKLISSLE